VFSDSDVATEGSPEKDPKGADDAVTAAAKRPSLTIVK
jgi:hypothetical protein